MTKLERGPMVGRMLEGDFEKDAITFHMPATYYLASGRYIIEPEADWVRRKEQLTALSARASAGEGGEWVLVPRDAITAAAAELSAQGCKDSASDLLQSMLTAAPQPAQAGASGGGVPVGEFQDWFEAWAKEKEEIILHRIADGRLISPTASIAESAFLAGCMTASMYYMELCRNDSTAATQPSEAHTCDFMDGLDDCPACKLGQSTCGYHTRNPATPPAHGDGEGAFASVAASKPCPACGSFGPCDDAQKCMNTAITTNFRGETFAEARQQLVNVLKAQKSWMTGYAESYVDEFADMATTRPTPEAQEARDAWTPVSERLPDEGTECLVLVQYGTDPKFYVAIDTWRMQREAPVSFSSATIETGLMWDENDFLDVLMWQPIKRPSQSAIDAALALPAQGES